jgi:hypothetical protein
MHSDIEDPFDPVGSTRSLDPVAMLANFAKRRFAQGFYLLESTRD